MQKIISLLLAFVGLTLAGQAAEVIHLGIGTQDTTINCAAGGPVVRELKLLDKYLPHDGKYQDATYDIHWVNLPTGAQLNNEVLAGRLDIGLSEFWRHYPSQLSGGMQQRVNLARVLVNRPEVLLMDEPFGALDAQTRLQMQDMLLGLWAEYGMTVVFVTHDVDEAILLSDRVLIMSRRPGRITAEIPVSLGRPRTLELSTSAEFLRVKRACLEHVRPEQSRSVAAQNTERASVAV